MHNLYWRWLFCFIRLWIFNFKFIFLYGIPLSLLCCTNIYFFCRFPLLHAVFGVFHEGKPAESFIEALKVSFW